MKGQPFFFDTNNFDDDAPPVEEEEFVEEPEFTQTTLDEEKQKSFEQGKQQGIKEAQQSIEKQTQMLLNDIAQKLQIFMSNEAQRNSVFETEAPNLTAKIYENLFPFLAQNFAADEITNAVKNALQNLENAARIDIRIHPDIKDKVEKAFTSSSIPQDQYIISAKEDIPNTQAQILWDGGGMLYNHEDIAKKTFDIIKDALAERGITVHDIQTKQPVVIAENDGADAQDDSNDQEKQT